jgi:hypothetical protein
LDTRLIAFGAVRPAEVDPFEWAVTAAASIGVHLAGRNRRVTAVTAHSGAADSAAAILDLLAETRTSQQARIATLGAALRSTGSDRTAFAVLAAAGELAELHTRGRSTQLSVAFLLDIAHWETDTDSDEPSTQWLETADLLRGGGWRVMRVRAGDDLAALWPAALSARATAL